MAGVITWNRLRELAAFRAENGLAISLYVGFDPSVAGTIPAAATKLNSLLDEAQKSTLSERGELTHDQKAGLQSDFERIRTFFANDFDRAGTQGLAVLAGYAVAFGGSTVERDGKRRVASQYRARPWAFMEGRLAAAVSSILYQPRHTHVVGYAERMAISRLQVQWCRIQ